MAVPIIRPTACSAYFPGKRSMTHPPAIAMKIKPTRYPPVSYTHLDVYKRQPLVGPVAMVTNSLERSMSTDGAAASPEVSPDAAAAVVSGAFVSAGALPELPEQAVRDAARARLVRQETNTFKFFFILLPHFLFILTTSFSYCLEFFISAQNYQLIYGLILHFLNFAVN